MAKSPREMSYFLAKPLNTEWLSSGWPGDIPSVTTGIVEVDFQRRTITLPEGKFDLDGFLHIAKDICLRLP